MESTPFSALVLEAYRFIQNLPSGTVHRRLVNDYEIDFYVGGMRNMMLNDDRFVVEAGTVVFRRPGDVVISSGSYNCYCLTLDFSLKKGDLIGSYSRQDPHNTRQERFDSPLLDCIPCYFDSSHVNDYMKIFDRLTFGRLVNDRESDDLLINRLLFLMISDSFSHRASSIESKGNHVLTDTCKYIEENFHRQLTLKELAENVSLSTSYFLKTFKRLANMTPNEYIISIRLSHAKLLLAETKLSISEIAEQCGYNDTSYFSYYFKKSFGITPFEYRAEHRANTR